MQSKKGVPIGRDEQLVNISIQEQKVEMKKKTQKVLFELDCNEDGYPPIEYELVNVTALSEITFQVDNAPLFIRNLSYNDVVQARKSETKDQFNFVCVKEKSSYTSISIIILDSSMNSCLMDLVRGFDCVTKYGEFGMFRILAVAIPATSNYFKLREQLLYLEERSKITIEELAVAH